MREQPQGDPNQGMKATDLLGQALQHYGRAECLAQSQASGSAPLAAPPWAGKAQKALDVSTGD